MDLRKKVFSAIVFLLVLGLCAFTYGQILTGSIKGVVQDADGVPLPGVTVEVQGPALIGGPRSTITSDRGLYRFGNLPPGTYELTFTLGGFQTVVRKGLIVSVDKTITENVTMSMEALEEEVTVLAETPVVDLTKSGVSTSWQTEMMDSLPLLRTCFFDLVNSSPGVWSYGGDTRSSRSVAYGTSSESNTYLFDGVDTTADMYGAAWAWLNPDTIQEIQVIGIGSKAEYGNFMGATVNIVTKSGGNEFHGAAGGYFQFQSLTGSNSDDYLQLSLDQGYVTEDDLFPYNRHRFRDLSFQIGGPIIKDKAWFFASVWHQYDASTPAGVNPDFYSTFDDTQAFLKMTIQATKNLKINGFFNNEWFDLPDSQTPANESLDSVGTEKGILPTASLGLTAILSDATFLELKYNFTGGDDHYASITGSKTPSTVNLNTGEISGGLGYDFYLRPTRHAIMANLSHFAEDFIAGDHDFKFGIQYSRAKSSVTQGYPGGANYANYTIYAYDYTIRYRYQWAPYQYSGANNQISGFIDDTWAVNDRLTLNVGFRYDHNTGRIPDQPIIDIAPDGSFVETSEMVDGIDDLVKWRVFSPRLGFAFMLTSDGKTLLRANAGRYYDQMIYGNWQSPAPSGTPWILSVWAGNDWLPIFSFAPERVSVDPGLKNPYSDQFSVGIDRELTTDLGLSFTYMEKWTNNMIGFAPTTGDWEDYYGLVTVPDPYSGGTVQAYNLLASLSPELQITNPDRYFARFRMFSMILNKRFSHNWQLMASFTYSKMWGLNPLGNARQGYGENILYNSGTAKDPNHFLNLEGLLPADRPYSLKILGTYLFPWGISTSVNFQMQTGSPFSRTVLALGLNQGPQTVAAEQRGDNDHRFANAYLLDLNVEKTFRIGGRFSLAARFEVFNILNCNTNGWEMITYTLMSPEQDFVPLVIWPPRRAQIGVKLRF